MHLKRRLKERRAAAAVAAGVATVLGLCFLFSFLGEPLERLSFDLPFSLRPDIPVNEIVVVYMDELSHNELHQPYDAGWDRSLHARLLRDLTEYGAKAVAFDLLLSVPGRAPGEDDALAGAIRTNGHVVLGCKAIPDDTLEAGAELKPEMPLANFRQAAAAVGFMEFKPDSDDAVRQHIEGWPDLPSFTWALANTVETKATTGRQESHTQRWLNFYGPPEYVPHLSYLKALNHSDPAVARLFQGKVVFVGQGKKTGFSGKRQDLYRTPYRWAKESRASGTEIHATMFLNLTRGDWLERLNPWLEFGLVLSCGLAAGIGLVVCRPLPATLAALVAIVAMGGVGVLLPWTQRVWFAWLIPCVVQMPAALFCSLITSAQKKAVAIEIEATVDYSPAPAKPGEPPSIPDHQLLRRIGSGSYGEVWLARSVTGAHRAAKVIQRAAFADQRQFEREFGGVRKFEPISRLHDGLVDILHVGRNDAGGYFYYVMELADDAIERGVGAPESRSNGRTTNRQRAHTSSPPAPQDSITPERYIPRTLRHQFHKDGPLGFEECLRLGLALCAALDFLHRSGLVHRDIKPSNIIFVHDEPKLADIGLVTEAGEARSLVGTEGYIAPEGPGTPQADLYSLGKVLYEAVTGLEVARFPELPTTSAKSPADDALLRFYEVTLKACATEPARRFTSAAATQAELMLLVRHSLG
jgi:CHASE2 domain-containing sensor protein